MTDRDRWARLTPYEVGIPGREFADRVFANIRREAEARDLDAGDPGAFILLGEVGRAIREIQGEERGGEAIHRYGAFLFHAYHFHRAGEPLLLLEEGAARHIVESAFDRASWEGGLPAAAGYLQLPRNLFWSDPGDDGTPEPLDGISWVLASEGTLSLLLALGVREGRPGISVIEVPPLEISEAGRWLTEKARESGEDFDTKLPGGELDRLYSLVTLGEVLKLATRAFAHLAEKPESLGPEERAPRPNEGESDAHAGPPSALPFRRITPGGAVGEGSAPKGDTGGEGEP